MAHGFFLTRQNINGLLAKGSGDAERGVIEDVIDLNIAISMGFLSGTVMALETQMMIRQMR
jgi:hypothetical protein